MKVSQATINLYLKTAKTLADGSHPIMLRVCFKGFKDVSTHYSCSQRYWDKKNQCIKKGYPNFTIANYELNKMRARITAKRDEFIRLGIEYTPQMLLAVDEAKKSVSNVVVELIDSYYIEKELRGSTVTGWKHSRNCINEFQKGVIISEIDEGWCKRYARWLEIDRGQSEGTIRTRLGHIAAIFRYASRKGLVSMDRYPYKDWNYCQKYKLSERIQFIHEKSVNVMKEFFLSKVIKANGKMFTYIDDGYVDYKNRLFVIYFWLLGYYLQGLSPIDICLLRKSDFKTITVNGEDYYSIDTSREKTSVGVKIRIKKHSIYSQVMIMRMLMTDGEWFLPIMKGLNGKDIDKCKARMRSIMSYWLNPKLRDWWRDINSVIIQKNMSEKSNIPLIDETCTFYSYRHSFAQAYMSRGGYPMNLATLMGRSEDTLSVYLRQLSEEADLVSAVSVMED